MQRLNFPEAGFEVTAQGILRGRSGEQVQLSHQSWLVFHALTAQAGEIVSREAIETAVWDGQQVEDGAIYKTVSRLRKHFEEVGLDAGLIQTVPRRGYRWDGPPVEPESAPPPEIAPVGRVPVAPAPVYPVGPAAWRLSGKFLWLTGVLVTAAVVWVLLGRRAEAKSESSRLYAEGRDIWDRRNGASDGQSLRLFRAAAASNPADPLPWTGIADALAFQPFPAPGAKEAVARALALDPTCGEAYISRGFIYMVHDLDWDAARKDFAHGWSLSPKYPTGLQWFGIYSGATGDIRASLSNLRQDSELAPDSIAISRAYARVLFLAGRRDDALREIDFIADKARSAVVYHAAFELHWLAGDVRPARYYAQMLAVSGISSTEPVSAARLLEAYCSATPRPRNIDLARCASMAGDGPQAVALLREAIQARDFEVFNIKADPTLEAVRNEPGFRELLDLIHLK